MATNIDETVESIRIAIVGKYNNHSDAYLSVMKAVVHSCISLALKPDIVWIDASDLEERTEAKHKDKYESAWALLKGCKCIIVPGGFGVRGVEGKVLATKYAREARVPFLGVCLGMQVMVIEYARHVLGLQDANSTEFDEATEHPVIVFMPEINHNVMGGTMRLGARPTSVAKDYVEGVSAHGGGGVEAGDVTPDSPRVGARTLASEVYATEEAGDAVIERHRHRYEVNPKYTERLRTAGLVFSGTGDMGVRMEIAELRRDIHPYYLGTQFHPEFKSRPNRPSPPFFGLIATASGRTELLGQAGREWQKHETDSLSQFQFSPMSPSHARLLHSPASAGKRRSNNVGGGERSNGGADINRQKQRRSCSESTLF